MKNSIILKTDEELKIVMSPIRQKIIKTLNREGRPVTSKYIADKLSISPSSAQHHISKLQQIGVVEFSHSEIINGINAKYLKLTDKTISIGHGISDDLTAERDILSRNILSNAYSEFNNIINTQRKLLKEEYKKGNKMADQLSGVVHLTTEDANKLFDLIDDFIKSHSNATKNSHPYEYALIAFRADLANNAEKE